MTCLKHPDLMELIYGEAKRERLADWHRHLADCPDCLTAYLDLKETHDWIQRHKEPDHTPLPILLPGPHRQSRGGWVAAAVAVVLMGLSLFQSARATRTLQAVQGQLSAMDHRVAQAEYRMDENTRDQYYLLMALKEYTDRNMNERRAGYETVR